MASPQPRIGVVTYPGSQDDRDALWALAALDGQRHVAADEAKRLVSQQRTWEQAGLAEDLEAVADPEHQTAGAREVGDTLHHR